MAEEESKEQSEGKASESEAAADCPSCPECPPEGLPGWMATFSDMITLLLTFFILLLSFAKTESSKFKSALGSIRDAFGGNVLKMGEVIERGKSADNQPTMLEGADVIRPFPIEFMTTEGLLDKREINRPTQEQKTELTQDLNQFSLSENASIEEVNEGLRVIFKDPILFKKNSIEIESISVAIFDSLVKMLRQKRWILFVRGHASHLEEQSWQLSSKRAMAVVEVLLKRGILADQLVPISYGSSKEDKAQLPAKNQKVDFILRKEDISGH